MLVCGGLPAAGAFPTQRQKPRRKTSMVFDVKLEDEHVYVVVDDEVGTAEMEGWCTIQGQRHVAVPVIGSV